MAYWLLKTEPGTYSFAQLQKEGITRWDGISSNAALKNIRSMKKGDLAFIYHSGDEKAIQGLAEIISDPYPDPKESDPKLVAVDIKAKRSFSKKVSLSELKKRKEFASFDLVRIPRLSVMPVSDSLAAILLELTK